MTHISVVAIVGSSRHCPFTFAAYSYLTIREGVLTPSAEASSGPSAHPRRADLTLRLLTLLEILTTFNSNVPVLIHLHLRDVFQIVFFVSQQVHYIFLEGVEIAPYSV